MKIITVANRKGGTGKTATAHALGIGLKNEGYKVLFIDLDSQCNLSHALGLPITEDNKTIYQVLTDEININDAIKTTNQADIIASSNRLMAVETLLNEIGKEYKIREVLEQINKTYDYVIIDTGAQLGVLTINALTVSNEVIIPVQADIYSLRGIGLINETINAIKKYTNKDLKISGILLTRYNPRLSISKGIRETIEKEITNIIDAPLFNNFIRECTAIKEAQFLQRDIYSYAPKSNASIDYQNFVNEYLRNSKDLKEMA